MRIHLWLPVMAFAAVLGISTCNAEAGSFFGPCCYGADYTYKYPNRSHNVFGCGPGSPCQACHPFFRHHWLRKNQGMVMNEGAPSCAVPIAPQSAPIVPTPAVSGPFHTTSIGSGPVPVVPTVRSGTVSFPAPLPAGSVSVEPPSAQPSLRPSF